MSVMDSPHTRTIYVKYDLGRKSAIVVKDLVTIFYCTIPCLLSISPSKGMVSYSAFEMSLEVLFFSLRNIPKFVVSRLIETVLAHDLLMHKLL